MPQVRKLEAQEVQAIQDKGKGIRRITEDRYDEAFAQFEVGDYGEITPDVGENRLTSRNRIKAAATRRGLDLTFSRSKGEAMVFKVEQGNVQAKAKPRAVKRERDYQDEPTPVVPALNTPPKKKGGRKKKQTVE